MASLHGWINEVRNVKQTKDDLQTLEKECGVQTSIHGMNGCNCVTFFYDRNHYGFCFEKVLDLFRKLAKNRESFGMIYIQDDESEEFHDSFQVYIARRGIVEKVADKYFTPCSEKVWVYDEN